MKFDVGDTVLVLHSGEEGVVVEILDEETVSVKVGGIIFPAYIDQLDFPYFKRFTEGGFLKTKETMAAGENIPVEKPGKLQRNETGVFLSFLPEFDHSPDGIVQSFKIHLMNETGTSYQFHYRLLLNQMLEIELSNTLFPFSHIYLHNLAFESFNDRPQFSFNFSLTEQDPHKAENYDVLLKPRAKQFIKKLEKLKEKQQATFSYSLFEKYPDKADKAGDQWNIPFKQPAVKYATHSAFLTSTQQYETDLHIEKLTNHPGSLTVTDILAIQLGELQRQLDKAIAHRQFSLVVIHGVGTGRLRDEVHEILKRTPEVKYFVNQYDIRYGYGATEIFFQYN